MDDQISVSFSKDIVTGYLGHPAIKYLSGANSSIRAIFYHFTTLIASYERKYNSANKVSTKTATGTFRYHSILSHGIFSL